MRTCVKSLTPCSWLTIAVVILVARLQNWGSVPASRPVASCGMGRHLQLFLTPGLFVYPTENLCPSHREPLSTATFPTALCTKQPLPYFTGSRESPTDGFHPGLKQPAPESHLNRSACQRNFPSARKPGFAAPVVSPGGHQWDLRISSTSDHAGPEAAPSCGHPADGAAGMPRLCGRPLRLGIPGVCLQNRTLLRGAV